MTGPGRAPATGDGSAAPGGRVSLGGWGLVVLGAVLAVVALVLALGRSGGGTPAPDGSPAVTPASTPAGWDVTEIDLAAYAQGLADATNAARSAEGLDPLTDSSCAREGAAGRVRELVGDHALEHAPLAPVISACAPSTTAAENLSRAAAQPLAVVEAWLGSPGHRANVLDGTLEELGVACLRDGDQVLCSAVFLGP